MKYTKPQDHNYRLQGAYSDALEQFARSLPAEFEIATTACFQQAVIILGERCSMIETAIYAHRAPVMVRTWAPQVVVLGSDAV